MYLSHVHADVLGCGSGNGLRELWREGNALLGDGNVVVAAFLGPCLLRLCVLRFRLKACESIINASDACAHTLLRRNGSPRFSLLRRWVHTYVYLADMRGHALDIRTVLRILLARWKNRFQSCRLHLAAGMEVRDFLDPVPEERNNRIDNIRQHQGLGSRVKRYLPEFIRKNDIKAKATSVVLDLGGIVPTAVAVFGFGPLKDMKGVDGVVLWLCTFVLTLAMGLFAAWRKRYWNRLRNCQRILSEKAESTENVDKVVQAVPSHVIQ